MEPHFTLTLDLPAPPEKVWQLLTDPELVSQYMFGTRPDSDWREGSPLTYLASDEDDNQLPVVSGTIVKADKPNYLEHTVFPVNAPYDDVPENHLTVIYRLTPQNGGTHLEMKQAGFDTVAEGEKRYEDAKAGWEQIMPKIRELAAK